MKWCVSFPEEQVLVIRPSIKAICMGNKPAANLLSVLLYRQSIRQEHKSDAENINEVKAANRESADQDTTYRIFRKQHQLVTDMCDEITEKTLHDVAVPMLQVLGFLEIEEHLACNCYILNMSLVRSALKIYVDTPDQLEKFLIDGLQLEKFLIDKKEFLSAQMDGNQLEIVLFDKKKFLLQLEKVLIWNRNSSNCPRGRKASPEEAADPVFETPKSIKRESKNTRERKRPSSPPKKNIQQSLSSSASASSRAHLSKDKNDEKPKKTVPPKTERPARPPAPKRDLLAEASPEAQAVVAQWRAIFKRPVAVTKTLIEHATTLAAFQPEPGEIAQCRTWMYSVDRNKWYSSHGMHLGDLAEKNFEKFRSLGDVPEKNTGGSPPEHDRSEEARAQADEENRINFEKWEARNRRLDAEEKALKKGSN